MIYGLTDQQREQFVRDGFVKIDAAFPSEIARQARMILWQEIGFDPEDARTWTSPVVRLTDCAQEPFQKAANTPKLHAAFDELAGVGRWIPRESIGGMVIRFPHTDDPGDTGWHIDASFPPADGAASYFDWRINIRSKGRVLLMLFLFSDVTKQDAPTRIRVGSHLVVARLLAPVEEAGMSMMEISQLADRETQEMEEVFATGPAGTVYLCHPFLIHASQAHRGSTPRFLGQPPLYSRLPLELERHDGDYSLVERAILLGLHGC
ncbi:MAG: phytanoyl-CoA dioxygenase family protein [Gammaproteobacteria bacterium]|nr:phytanoyl-CoA dioxygenase family protein [Gammaproteobacteria bacterium]